MEPGAGTPLELPRAALLISIDTEMSWGLVHRPSMPYRYDDERPHLQRLLDLFDRHQVPATWAVVGHLFLERCAPVDGVKHPEIVRPDYDWFDGDWFDADPCTDVHTDPAWYGPDVVDAIRERRTTHEIASHGFSHLIAGDPGCSRATFRSEVDAAQAVAADAGVALRSFIHPRNRIGHVDVLADAGFTSYRGPRPAASGERPSAGQRLVDKVRGSQRTVVRPLLEDRIVNFPATILYDVDARARTWRPWVHQVERRMAQAVRERSLFHLWFHPHNLRDHPEAAFTGLDHLCRTAARWRDRGLLDTVTMGELSGRLLPAAAA